MAQPRRPRSVLITQCIQNDFVRPLLPEEPLPNLVHVGHAEAQRLCGETGALIPFLRAAHAVDPAELAIIHIADAHDPVRHARHFALFRPHCVAGTAGAELIPPVGDMARARPETAVIRAADLSDFEDSDLAVTLQRLLGPAPEDDLTIGVIGVWTDVKVAYLLYDLATRLRVTRLATCSALTASRSLDAHFRALEHLAAVLGVRVLHSPGSFLAWLLGREPPAVPDERERLLGEREAGGIDLLPPPSPLPRGGGAQIDLAPLHGGYSGAEVFIARRGDAPAHVLKIGPRDEIAGERFGNERVRRVLGNFVPRLLGYREGGRLAAMEVELARSGGLTPQTFKSAYASPGPEVTELLDSALVLLTDHVLGRFYRTAEKDNGDLFEIYGFVDAAGQAVWGEWMEQRAEAVARGAGFASRHALFARWRPADPWMDPVEFYRDWLAGRRLRREIYPSVVHGDLNFANILIARREGEAHPARIWVIDFARLARLPNLTDFAKLENDLSFILLPLGDEEPLIRAGRLSAHRIGGATLTAPGLCALAATADERRYVRLLLTLRRIAAETDGRGAAAMEDYRVALLRYAAVTLGYAGLTPLQRCHALLSCAHLCGMIGAAWPGAS
jgi:nicotinamidase-related amidase